MRCISKKQCDSPGTKANEFISLLRNLLADKVLTAQKVRDLSVFIGDEVSPTFRELKACLDACLEDGAHELTASRYVAALRAIRATLPPFYRKELEVDRLDAFIKDIETDAVINPPSEAQMFILQRKYQWLPESLTSGMASFLIDPERDDVVPPFGEYRRSWERQKATSQQKWILRLFWQNVPEQITKAEAINALRALIPPEVPNYVPESYYDTVLGASDRQKEYLRDLGGEVTPNMTRKEASDRITALQSGITVRQRMIFRFWNKDENGFDKNSASIWMDNFYTEDPNRKLAWELWKEENTSVDVNNRVSEVPVGGGYEYLEKLKRQKGILGWILSVLGWR